MRTRSTLTALMLIGVSIVTQGVAQAGQGPKYGVTVQESKRAALANVKTYRWTQTRPSFDPTIDAQIVVAVDRELEARGLTKVTGPSDLVVTYSSLSRTDVDLKSKVTPSESTKLAIGTLTLDLRDGSNRSSLFRVRMDTPIETDRAKLEGIINASVAAMFEKYPGARVKN